MCRTPKRVRPAHRTTRTAHHAATAAPTSPHTHSTPHERLPHTLLRTHAELLAHEPRGPHARAAQRPRKSFTTRTARRAARARAGLERAGTQREMS